MNQILTNSKLPISKDLSTSLRRSHFKEVQQMQATKSKDSPLQSTALGSPPLNRYPAIAQSMAKKKKVRRPVRLTFRALPTQKRPRLKAQSQSSVAWSTKCARIGGRRGRVNMEISAYLLMAWRNSRSEALPTGLNLQSPLIPFSPLLFCQQRM